MAVGDMSGGFFALTFIFWIIFAVFTVCAMFDAYNISTYIMAKSDWIVGFSGLLWLCFLIFLCVLTVFLVGASPIYSYKITSIDTTSSPPTLGNSAQCNGGSCYGYSIKSNSSASDTIACDAGYCKYNNANATNPQCNSLFSAISGCACGFTCNSYVQKYDATAKYTLTNLITNETILLTVKTDHIYDTINSADNDLQTIANANLVGTTFYSAQDTDKTYSPNSTLYLPSSVYESKTTHDQDYSRGLNGVKAMSAITGIVIFILIVLYGYDYYTHLNNSIFSSSQQTVQVEPQQFQYNQFNGQYPQNNNQYPLSNNQYPSTLRFGETNPQFKLAPI